MDESRLLLSKAEDLVTKYYSGENSSLGFLNELEVSQLHNYLSNQYIDHFFFGGYPSATRMMLYLDPDYDISADVSALSITAKGDTSLTHRDYLGSMMGLGIERQCIGDIIVRANDAVVFVKKEICDYILTNLSTVGRQNVTVRLFEGDLSELRTNSVLKEVLVTSLRIDNFVASICNFSRQKALEYINSDKVFINYSVALKLSKPIICGDTVSIRGYGKYKIGEVLRTTKGSRLVLSVMQYE